jgi:N-acetyl-gamma-glutamyl-phosphate reductase
MINVAVIGGSGYTGGELIRLLLEHPGVNLSAVASRRLESKPVSDAFPWLGGLTDLTFSSPEAVIRKKGISLVFTALGHMESVPIVSALLAADKKVVDLSADFRLKDAALYDIWYKQKHAEPDLLARAVYGLPERYRDAIRETGLVANPGCYATASILGLLPLAAKGLLPAAGVIIDAKSGVSGAGRVPKEDTVFPECHEGLRAYAVARHRHQPEIEAILGEAAGSGISTLFVPHLVPANRGILATIYLDCSAAPGEVQRTYEDFYWKEPFVKVNPPGRVPGIQDVKGSNYCRIAVAGEPSGRRVIIFSVIDNLVKGAAGQAVQNMNIMLGLPEESGLTQLALSP